MVCHVALASEWSRALEIGSYDRSFKHRPISDAGYIYSSDSYEQAARVVRYLLGDVSEPLVLLDIRADSLTGVGLHVVNEAVEAHDPSSEKFPHLYGGALPVCAVAQAREFASIPALLAVLDAGEKPLPHDDAEASH